MASGSAPTNLLLNFIFIVSFGVFIASAYGVGKGENKKEGVYETASVFLSLSIFSMFASWFFRWGLNLPADVEGFKQSWYDYTGLPNPT